MLRDKIALAMRETGRPVHFLHIGKAGGTAIKFMMAEAGVRQLRFRFVGHSHKTKLASIPMGEPFFFSIREPISRYFSAFYSRKRKGQPRIFNEWTAEEELAFRKFPDATDLAESLDSSDDKTRNAAFMAMNAIGHVRDPLVNWFASIDEIVARPPLAIIRVEFLQDDFNRMLGSMGLHFRVMAPSDSVSAHKNDYTATPPLSPRALSNLREHYAQDLTLFEELKRYTSVLSGGSQV
jgi:hypothetical protein